MLGQQSASDVLADDRLSRVLHRSIDIEERGLNDDDVQLSSCKSCSLWLRRVQADCSTLEMNVASNSSIVKSKEGTTRDSRFEYDGILINRQPMCLSLRSTDWT